MIRCSPALFLAALLAPASRGDDPDLELRVKVALALSGDCCTPSHPAAPDHTMAGAMDWLVPVSAPRVEPAPAPAPKVAPKKKEPAAPAPAPAKPAKQLWLMHDYWGNQWLEWRDPAPKIMPPPAPVARPAALDWRVLRPAVLDPFAPCVGST